MKPHWFASHERSKQVLANESLLLLSVSLAFHSLSHEF
jgi:hypothetical protein